LELGKRINYQFQNLKYIFKPSQTPPPPFHPPSLNDDAFKPQPTRKPSTTSISIKSPDHTEPPTQPSTPHHHEKDTQCQKPLYDGYILAPNAFAHHLTEPDQPATTYAHFQYKSTEHLRTPATSTANANKKDTYTSTDSMTCGAEPLAPSILFKLKFDTDRKDREEIVDEVCKDFVNVVDLDSRAVDEILTLIQSEQDKRTNKYVETKRAKKLEILPEETLKREQLLEEKETKEEEDKLGVKVTDGLTEGLFAAGDDDWREYDEVIRREVEEASKKSGCSVSRQRVLNEFRYIDEKIRAMNEMAAQMTGDCERYREVLGSVQAMGKERQAIERYQQRQEAEERKRKEVTEAGRRPLEISKKKVEEKRQTLNSVEASVDAGVRRESCSPESDKTELLIEEAAIDGKLKIEIITIASPLKIQLIMPNV
jgi:hypothetical protein